MFVEHEDKINNIKISDSNFLNLNITEIFKMKTLHITLLILFLLVNNSNAKEIIFAGTGYLASNNEIESKFPNLCSLSGDSTRTCYISDFNKFYNLAVGYSNETISIVDKKSSDAINYMIALAFEEEVVEEVFALGKRNLQLGLIARVVLYDFEKKNLLASYPISVRTLLTCETSSACSNARIKSEFKNLIFGENSSSILKLFPEMISKINPNPGRLFIQINEIEIGEKAPQVFNLSNADKLSYKKWLASTLEVYFSKNLNIPILPYTQGQVVGSVMPLKIADTEKAFDLSLPPASFFINFRLRGQLKKLLDETNNRQAYSYISGIKVQLASKRQVYFDHKFQRGNVVNIPKDAKVSDASQFKESLRVLINQLSGQFFKPETKWIKKHKSDKKIKDKVVAKDFKNAESLVLVKVR